MGDGIPSAKQLNAQTRNKNARHHRAYKANSKIGTNNQATKTTSEVPLVSKLPSNWDKYDRALEDDGETSVDVDFDILQQLPTSSNQFQLKQDKVFLPTNESSLNSGDFFQLDMNLINLGLSTIPFYKRIGISEALLSENELQIMNKTASEANETYQLYLSKKKSKLLEPNEEKIVPEIDLTNCEESEIGSEDLDNVNVALPHKDDETTKLEEWLDNVL